MNKIINILSFFILTTTFWINSYTQNIVGYQYAFNNGEGLQFQSVAPTPNLNLNVNIDVSSLTNALNVFHIRFKDNTGKWSAMKSHLFMTHFSDVPSTKQIVGYEYAFNNGVNLTYVPVTPGTDFNLLTDINVSSLTNALNVFHIRFKDNTGKWSVMKSHLFMTHFADIPSTKQIVGYEYAFNNGANLTYVPVTPGTDFNLLTDINVSSLTNALNVFHIRFKDNTGKWSAMKSHLFMTHFADVPSTKQIVGYEYAFNNGANLTYVPVTPGTDFNLLTDINVSSLTNALNVFHIRFKDNTGKWSAMKSHLFMTQFADVPSTKQIVGYEYAFNNGANLTYVPVTPGTDFNLLTDINVSSLTNALNVFHIRFKDNTGKWSAMKSHLFMTHFADVPSTKQIVGYEYAFNNGSNLTYVPVTPGTDFNLLTDIDVSALTKAVNVFHIRFKDNTGKFSVMKSHLFMKPFLGEQTPDNRMVQYWYWVDAATADKVTFNVNPAVNPLNVTQLDLTHVWEGVHYLHTQFKDVYGKYSVVYTDTIQKNPYPVARFVMDASGICVGQSVGFHDDKSVDFNTVSYNFGDGQTATEIETTHTYTSAGTFNVVLTVFHTASGLSGTMTKQITVHTIPVNTVTLSKTVFPLCYGTELTMTADETGANYLWSTGETTRSITVTSAGTYNVTVTNPNLNTCSATSQNYVVTYHPQIDATVTLQEFPLLLTANQTNATYQWIDCTNGNIPINGATQASYEPTINGNYAVQITQNGCAVTSNCVTISTVNIADYEIKQLVKMYPNPANTFVNFNSDIAIEVTIYNTTGAMIWKGNFDKGINTFDMTNMSSGLYLTKITAQEGAWENQSAVYRLIRE